MDTLKNESSHSDVQGLVSQARAAYQQNRIKECLALTKALLLSDPGNAAAIELQNAVRSDMLRDMSDARGLLEESKNKPEGQKYRKAAEIILLKTLHLDPENEAAKTLLSSVRSLSEHTAPEPPAAHAAAVSHAAPIDAAVFENVTRPEPARPEPVGFTTGIDPVVKSEKKKRSSAAVPLIVAAIVVLGGGAFMARQWLGTPNVSAASAPVRSTQSRELPTSDTLAAAVELSAPAQAKATLTSLETPSSNSANASSAGDAIPAATPKAAETGSLAVSSAVPAEIYLGDKNLGSTPTTLQLPAGNQTLEYRHGDLRTVVTHVVKPNETISARITFDVLVQVNAKPWAQVYIDGTARLPLGQTPLSNVRVPIGSVLVFENPNFPSKSHTIALNDKTVQMVFQ